MLESITPIIICFNEQANLKRSLGALKWANEVLVIDSGSTDQSLQICQKYSNVRVVHNPFKSFAQQCNFALKQEIKTPWVLSMDADYVVTPELQIELSKLDPPASICAYQIQFQYLLDGQALRGSLYPARTCLYRVDKAFYQQDGHAHKVVIDGQIGHLMQRLQHDDRKPQDRWFASQKNYAKQEADKLTQSNWRQLNWPDRFRKLGLGPALILPYTLIFKGLILDGKIGWQYTKQRLVAEQLLHRALRKGLGSISSSGSSSD